MIDLKFEQPVTDEVEVDDETLAAIDRGIEDVQAGRTVPMEEVRKKIPQSMAAERRPLTAFRLINAGPWPEGLSLRREDMYGDHGW